MGHVVQKITAYRVWIDDNGLEGEVFRRARKEFRVSDIVELEEYVHEKLTEYTDAPLTSVFTEYNSFVIEMDFEQVSKIWGNEPYNILN